MLYASYRVPVEADTARVHIEAVQHLSQGLVQPQHDLHLAVGMLGDERDGSERSHGEDLRHRTTQTENKIGYKKPFLTTKDNIQRTSTKATGRFQLHKGIHLSTE